VKLHERGTVDEPDCGRWLDLEEVDDVRLTCAQAQMRRERLPRQLAVRHPQPPPAHPPAGLQLKRHELDVDVGWDALPALRRCAGTENARLHVVCAQSLQQTEQATSSGATLGHGRHHRDDQNTQGCKSMAHMISQARALPRRILGGGAAGDAGVAGGRRIVSNVVVQLVSRVIMMALSVITVSLAARTLHPTGYGVWNGVSAFVGLFGVLTSLGFTTAATQRMAAEPEREGQWLGALVVTRTCLSLVTVVICAVCVPLFLSDVHDAHLVAFIMIATIPLAGAAALTTVFETRLRAGLLSFLNVLQSLIWLAIVLGLALTKGSVVAFAVADTALLVLMTAIQVSVTRRFAHVDWRAGMKLWRSLARTAVPLAIAGLAISIYWQLDSVLLLQLGGPRESGLYGAAYGFLSPLTFLPAAVMTSLFPVMAAVHGRDPARSRRLVQMGADAMAVLALPILAGTIALSGPIVHLLYGNEFQRAAGLLPILMLAFVSICYGSLAGYLAPVIGKQWRLATFSAVGAVANIALNVLLIPPYGAYGSAWATVATELLTMIPMLSTSLRTLRIRLVPWRMLRTLALAAAMTGVMVLARPLGLFPAGLIGVLFYAAGLLALRIVNWQELRAMRALRA
jgi:O-antigen/teichoic acid export membrane protein